MYEPKLPGTINSLTSPQIGQVAFFGSQVTATAIDVSKENVITEHARVIRILEGKRIRDCDLSFINLFYPNLGVGKTGYWMRMLDDLLVVDKRLCLPLLHRPPAPQQIHKAEPKRAAK